MKRLHWCRARYTVNVSYDSSRISHPKQFLLIAIYSRVCLCLALKRNKRGLVTKPTHATMIANWIVAQLSSVGKLRVSSLNIDKLVEL